MTTAKRPTGIRPTVEVKTVGVGVGVGSTEIRP